MITGKIEVGPPMRSQNPAAPLMWPGTDVAPVAFTANDCLDIGTDLGSPVSLDYFDKAPFAFNGKIDDVRVQYLTGEAGSRALQ
jgi:hypothetical protein